MVAVATSFIRTDEANACEYTAESLDQPKLSVGLFNVCHMSPRQQRGFVRAGSSSRSEAPPPKPPFTLDELQPIYEQVQHLRLDDRTLSREERALRGDLTQLIKYLKRQSRKGYDKQAISDLRRAQRMQDRLDGVPDPGRRIDAQVAKDWNETRDRSELAPRRALPRGGVRQVVRGGAPSLGRRT
jgi:hypothetical protein